MRINGIDLRCFSRVERAILIALGLAYPRRVTVQELTEYVYPNPDAQPDAAWGVIRATIYRLRRRYLAPDWRIEVPSKYKRTGYALRKIKNEQSVTLELH
jgi:DNA-binding SARP family transcriptional activator